MTHSVVKSYINDAQLYDDLKSMDRDNFTYEGAKALMGYLNKLAEDCQMNIEYDPIAFCCEYSEYGDALDCVQDRGYDCDFKDCEDQDKEDYALEYLRNNTIVIEFKSGIIIQDF